MTQPLPGSIAISRLQVYDTPDPDGQRGGTPHVHLLCAEMYFALEGSGAVELIDGNGFSCVELRPYTALSFSPGTIHRLINSSGDLQILVIMQNSGLPERGDNVVVFSEAWLNNDDKFREAMSVTSVTDAYQRRDRGVEGFLQLKAAFDKDLESGRAALLRFFTLAEQRTAHFRPEWRQIVQGGAGAALQRSLDQLQSLQNADISYLLRTQHQLIPAREPSAIGFCGRLDRYLDPALLSPEGIRTS
jgi:mannose-6-phosphate isomerase-like protein (cupin superfamily)